MIININIFFSDYYQENSFDIYIEKEGNFTYSPTSQDIILNDFKKYDFNIRNKENLFLFAIFNENYAENCDSIGLDRSFYMILKKRIMKKNLF